MLEEEKFVAGEYEVIVVGAGHAGVEAGLASARMGKSTLILTMSLDSIVALSCNPNIGGTGKGHLVREIDALGGEMALNIDKAFIQSKMLNRSKGPAVHSLRVQADKKLYHQEMKKVIENQEGLDLVQDEVVDLIIEDRKVKGLYTRSGAIYYGQAIIIATGTYLRGKIFMGSLVYDSGPDGMKPSIDLSKSLMDLGFQLKRLKTGTPARVAGDSINYSLMTIQPGDEEIIPFSFLNMNKNLDREQLPCWLTYTTEKTHEIINGNLNRSLMYRGEIEGIGPRYCPSLEDKIVRFPERKRHQIFIEPEGLNTKEMYVQGASSTLPLQVQLEMYKNIIGLEDVKIMRPAHAIEYDAIDATKLSRTLESKEISGLYFAGQVNGTSGYEEAASQGLIAGINAVLKIDGKEPFILDRSEGYIGVLIDDIVTKPSDEPYRMMTSRAEYRLTLRQDNADMRLTKKGYQLGLASEERYRLAVDKKKAVEEELERLKSLKLTPTQSTQDKLRKLNTAEIKTQTSLYDLIKRPELDYDITRTLDPERPDLIREIRIQVEIQIKYDGYIKKQMAQIDQFKKLENRKLDEDLDYSQVKSLSNEAIDKLSAIRPESIGQASRISGVSPADINMLLIYLEQERRRSSRDE